jgi:hypothetical protein
MKNDVLNMKRDPTGLIIALCCLLATAGTVGPGGFRWVLLGVSAVLAAGLAIRFIGPGSQRR